jgi:hypothetical protein
MVLRDTKECGDAGHLVFEKMIQCVEFVSDRLSSACAPRWQRSACNCCAIMRDVRFEKNVGSLREREMVLLIKKGDRRETEEAEGEKKGNAGWAR